MLVNPKGCWLVDQISRTDQEISLGAHKLSVPHPYPLIFSAAGFGPSKCLAWIFTVLLYQLSVVEPPAFPTGGAGRLIIISAQSSGFQTMRYLSCK